jgi:hypothetical protein
MLLLAGSASIADAQYTFKCGSTIYVCGKKITKDTMCVPGKYITSVETPSSKVCKPMVAAVKAFKTSIFTTNKYKCPNGRTLSHYVKYNSLGKNGKKYDKHGSAACKGAHCGGDPHFLTYEGTGYTYHGQCDLVMARSANINDSGLRLDIHARTSIIADWSYISHAAVRIGDDVLEVNAEGEHFLNGADNVTFPFKMGGRYMVNQTVKEVFPGMFRKDTLIDLEVQGDENDDGTDVIRISGFKGLLSVTVDAMLPDTYGMLGIHGKEGMIGRDLSTVLTDPNQMGNEWQVRNYEPKLFRDQTRKPQFPTQCVLPKTSTQRRLRAQGLGNEEMRHKAIEACADVDDDQMREFCIHDIMLTGDSDLSLIYDEH